MDFCITFFLLLNFLTMFLCDDEVVERQKNSKKLNVIIFFSQIDHKCVSLQKDTLGFLNLHEATRVKHSSENENAFEDISSNRKEGSAYCKELLKNSLMALTHYCHTVLKMKTAIASVSSQEVTNDIQEPEAPFHETNIGPLSEATPRTKRSQLTFKKKPLHGKVTDNSLKNKPKNIVTSTKHTEVFKIRVKRQQNAKHNDQRTKVKKEEHVKKRHNTKPPWDVLDVMKHVRYSFFGKIFENTLQNQMKADQEDLVDITKLGKEKLDPGLFATVKSTLATVLDPPEANFLMVIFGGHLHAVADKHSPIVQSIKHIIENTDSENTLIIVTGSCAENSAEEDGESENNNMASVLNHYTMPVYAKGPSCDSLSECTLLYDIPLTVRKILKLRNGSDLQFAENERM